MNIDIKKNGKVRLKDTPYFVPINDTNIQFSNMDVGTALITFQIMKGSLPLQVSKKNVYVYAYLESRNGTRSEVIDLQDVDPINGKVALQLDKDFLVGATNSIVDGQLYVTLHKWNDVNDDFSDTVALQKFSFSVEDALVNQISGVTKTEYIRTFDQLKTDVKERIKELEEDVGNIETLVDRVKQASTNAINKINDTRTKVFNEIEKLSNDTSTNIKELQDETVTRLNNAADNYINDIQNAKTEVVQLIDDEHLITTEKFEEYKSDLDEEIQTKLQEYEDFINENKNDFEGIINELDWQKYKLTQDNGKTLYDSNLKIDFDNSEQIESLGVGTRYIVSSINTPNDTSSNNGWLTKFDRGGVKYLEFRPFNSNQIWVKQFYNTWSDWELVNPKTSDTDWVPINTINDVKNNSAFINESDNGFQSAYRIIEENGVTRKIVRLNVSNVSHQTVIANLPKDFAKNVQFHYVRVPINMGYGLVGIFPSGSMYVYIESSMRESWVNGDSHYFYGQFEWTE